MICAQKTFPPHQRTEKKNRSKQVVLGGNQRKDGPPETDGENIEKGVGLDHVKQEKVETTGWCTDPVWTGRGTKRGGGGFLYRGERDAVGGKS